MAGSGLCGWSDLSGLRRLAGCVCVGDVGLSRWRHRLVVVVGVCAVCLAVPACRLCVWSVLWRSGRRCVVGWPAGCIADGTAGGLAVQAGCAAVWRLGWSVWLCLLADCAWLVCVCGTAAAPQKKMHT